MKHKAKHGALTDDRTLHRAEHEEDKAAREQPPLLVRDGGWERSELRSAARCPHSHSALMTHSDPSGRSHWLAAWNEHGFGAHRALIGCRRRPSIQTETRRRAAKCGSGRWSRTTSTFTRSSSCWSRHGVMEPRSCFTPRKSTATAAAAAASVTPHPPAATPLLHT